MIQFEPIGFFHTTFCSPYDLPSQPTMENEGIIQLKSKSQFEQALEGLERFDKIWIVFYFNQSKKWKSKILPPRGRKKQGVFATRSPHRPNFIGLSCVDLVRIEGLQLFIRHHDLLDGTPILDIKPYLNYADSKPAKRQGWLEDLPPFTLEKIEWSSHAQKQLEYLKEYCNLFLKEGIEHRLWSSPYPYPNNRVKKIKEEEFQLSYRTWRVYYHFQGNGIVIDHIQSGYDRETLLGEKKSKWEDVVIHRSFCSVFSYPWEDR